MMDFRKFGAFRGAFLTVQRLAKKLGFELRYTRVTGIPDAELYSPFFSPWRSTTWEQRLRTKDSRSLVPPEAKYTLHVLAEDAIRRCEGQLAECGVYKGGTAYLLADLARSAGRRLSLFDTFSGMPETDSNKDLHREGDFADVTLQDVRTYLAGFDNIDFYPGFVPDTLEPVSGHKFCFVHIDLDIYAAILSATSFFYDRIPSGGVLLYDDYGYASCPGARAAVDEFFNEKPEVPMTLSTGQCVVRKI
ncbi:MAG TPA: TylF/MycF/NovP-related O-methyltransferase [Candidatus Angelobacter sp.]|nr:TylF/MycF/NovP-related O-methyltransferase [Candidatus Angelobacter sp.]